MSLFCRSPFLLNVHRCAEATSRTRHPSTALPFFPPRSTPGPTRPSTCRGTSRASRRLRVLPSEVPHTASSQAKNRNSVNLQIGCTMHHTLHHGRRTLRNPRPSFPPLAISFDLNYILNLFLLLLQSSNISREPAFCALCKLFISQNHLLLAFCFCADGSPWHVPASPHLTCGHRAKFCPHRCGDRWGSFYHEATGWGRGDLGHPWSRAGRQKVSQKAAESDLAPSTLTDARSS